MSDVYITVPFVTDPDDLATQAFDYIESRFPGWLPNDGNLEVIHIEAISLIASALAFQASAVPDSIFRWLGPLVDINPINAAPATVASTWTAIDASGYTIHAGTHVGIRVAGDDLIPFTVVADVTIAPGDTATAAGAVQLQAIAAGSAGSGLGTVGGTVELIDPLGWVASIVQTAVTGGGVDAEIDATFLGRLRSEFQLLAPRPILPPDFAVLARTVAGVYRAVAIDGYNPADETSDNPRSVAVAAIDSSGNPVGGGIKTAVTTLLEGKREQNFRCPTFDPTLTDFDVTFSIAAADGFDPDTAVANATAAIQSFLSPASWGVPAGDPFGWTDQDVVRYTDLVFVVRRAAGVGYLVSLTFREHGVGSLGTADITMTGPAALPTISDPANISGSHT